MADCTLACTSCGKTTTISEFTEPDARKCPSCGAALPAISTPKTGALSLRLREEGADASTKWMGKSQETGRNNTRAAAPVTGGARLFAATGTERVRTSSSMSGLIVFLVVGGLSVGGAWYVRDSAEWRDVYYLWRWGLLAVSALIVIVDAFREGAGHGLLCLCFPPYLVWYAMTRVESYWIQAVVGGALALLIADFFWLSNHSIVSITSKVVEQFIDGVGDVIHRAGEAGVR